MQSKIQDDLKTAQLDRDETRVSVLRMLLSEMNYAKISKGDELTDPEIQTVISKELKKRREAAEAFQKGGRDDQSAKEAAEAKILEGYLPTQLSDEELTKLVEDTINELGASTIQDMGRVIGVVVSKAAGQAEGARVSNLVRQHLN